jgi:SAM-dependent methyltransferase
VLGVDVSEPLLARARERTAGLAPVRVLRADAAEHAFAAEHDVVFSRFGVMFFTEPERAFANLARALVAGGRLGFACWRRLEDNDWLSEALHASLGELGEDFVPPEPGAPGPFSLSEADRVRVLCQGAGLSNVEMDALDLDVVLSVDGPESAVDFTLRVGPVGRRVAEESEAVKRRVRDAVRVALARRASSDRIALPGRAWLVTASRVR